MKTTHQQKVLLNKLCAAFGFDSMNDRQTIITRDNCNEGCREKIDTLKPDIIRHYPKDFTRKLRSGKRDPKSNLTILRECLRFHHRHLVSIRHFKWCKKTKKSIGVYKYYII